MRHAFIHSLTQVPGVIHYYGCSRPMPPGSLFAGSGTPAAADSVLDCPFFEADWIDHSLAIIKYTQGLFKPGNALSNAVYRAIHQLKSKSVISAYKKNCFEGAV